MRVAKPDCDWCNGHRADQIQSRSRSICQYQSAHAVSATKGHRPKPASRTQTVIPGSGDPITPRSEWNPERGGGQPRGPDYLTDHEGKGLENAKNKEYQ